MMYGRRLGAPASTQQPPHRGPLHNSLTKGYMCFINPWLQFYIAVLGPYLDLHALLKAFDQNLASRSKHFGGGIPIKTCFLL